jgi:RNA polymerase sigma-70 factor, ECF subfamily
MALPPDPTEQGNPPFATVLAAARAGDEEALAAVLARTEQRLRRVVDHRLGIGLRSSLRRSDILQNSYLALLSALPRFTGTTEDDFVTWVARIIENDIRRQHRWLRADKRRPPSRTSQRNLLAAVLMPPSLTPSAELAASEEGGRLRQALANLEPDHVRIIELTVFEELSHRDVADRMGRSEGACRMLLMRARTALAFELERLANGGG